MFSSSNRKRKRPNTAQTSIPKTPRLNSPQFRHGSIRRIVLHNFLTFTDVVINPSPQLNVIVGPNGTGKSSIVCAICLGLGGPPKLLGRAKLLRDFVKHGSAKEASIEISLHHSSGNHPTIRREIKKETSSSKWFLNGQDKHEKYIIEFIEQFNIQLENKCQFLPQDKVVEFAKLDCYQLLEETEKAIGQNDMYEIHQKLKLLKTNKQSLEKSKEEHAKELDKLVRANSLLERDVTRLKTRQECIEKIKHLEWKRCWLEYENVRNVLLSCKKKRKEAEKTKRKLYRESEPLIKMIKEKEAILASFQDKEEKCCKSVKDAVKRVEIKHADLRHLHDDQEVLSRDYSAKQKEEEKRLKRIEKLKNEIQSFQSELAKLSSPEEIRSSINDINTELELIRRQLNLLQDKQQPLTDEQQELKHNISVAQDKLRKIDDIVNQRLSKLNERDHDAYKAICWLDNNRGMFKQPVHYPILVLLQIKNMKYAPQIEDFFMNKDSFTFIFESKDDYDLFASEVCDKMNLKVNVGMAPDTRLNQYRPAMSEQQLNSHGFRHVLLDLVDAPDAVLCYFCKYHYLHNIPIADRVDIDQFVNSQNEILKFYVGYDVYVAKRSRYSNKTVTRSNNIKPCRFFLSSVDEVEKATLTDNIKRYNQSIITIDNELKSLSEREKELRHTDSTARKNRNSLKESVNAISRTKRNIESRQIQIRQLSTTQIDLEQELVLYRESLADLFYKKKNFLIKIAENLKTYKNGLFSQTCSHFDYIEAEQHKKRYDREKEIFTNELKRAETELENVQTEEINTKQKAREKYQLAKTKTGFNSPDDIANSGYRDIFNDLPNDITIIEDAAHELKTQAELCTSSSLSDNGESIIEEYEKRKKAIEVLQEQITKDNRGLGTHNDKTSQLENKWLGPLEKMMEEIDERFSQFFKLMNCNGQVSLSKHPFDYSQFGVEIRVKFREEESLQILNAQRQSGGERSVSTMMYLMALQDITRCPFRVVDEINQGMDSANERRVFNLIVDTVNKENTSQYFMLTPKLLQGLKYTECVTVHAVHNGADLISLN